MPDRSEAAELPEFYYSEERVHRAATLHLVDTNYSHELIEPGSRIPSFHRAAFDARLGEILPVPALPRIVTSPRELSAYRQVDEKVFSTHQPAYHRARFFAMPERMRDDLTQWIDRVASGENQFMRGEPINLIVNTAGRQYDHVFSQLQEFGYRIERHRLPRSGK